MPIVKTQAFADLFAMVRAGNAWRFDATGALAQVGANLPRVDYDPVTLAVRGVRFEAGASNRVPNVRAEGAIITPGDAAAAVDNPPTGWSTIAGGINNNLRVDNLGTVVVAEVSRWRLRFYSAGAISGAFSLNLAPMTSTAILAAPGETLVASRYLQMIAGSLIGVTVRQRGPSGRSAGGGFLEGPSDQIIVPDGDLRQYASDPYTMINPSTARVTHDVQFSFASGSTPDFTIDYALPQLEDGFFASSVILPPVGAPGPSTRAADHLEATDLPRYLNPAAGTFVVQFTPGQATAPTHRGILTVDDGTGANEFRLRMLPGATTVRLSVDIAGVEVLGIEQASGAALVRHTARVSYGPAGWLLSVNGAAPIGAAGPIPSGLVRALLGRGLPAGEYLNGWLGPRFEYYPVQYTDTAAADGFTIRTR